MSALRIKNTSESDPRSHEATKAVAKKVQKKSYEAPTGYAVPWCFLCNCFSCFTTARIPFTRILYSESIFLISDIIYTLEHTEINNSI